MNTTMLEDAYVPADQLHQYIGWRVNGVLTCYGQICWDRIVEVVDIRGGLVFIRVISDAGRHATIGISQHTIRHGVDPTTGKIQPPELVANIVHVSRAVPRRW